MPLTQAESLRYDLRFAGSRGQRVPVSEDFLVANLECSVLEPWPLVDTRSQRAVQARLIDLAARGVVEPVGPFG